MRLFLGTRASAGRRNVLKLWHTASALVLALAGCTGPTVGVAPCTSDADCAGRVCDAQHMCVDQDAGGYDPAVLLDDFEDGNAIPSWSAFALWQSYSYNPPGQAVWADFERPGFDSNVDQFLEFVLQGLDYPGAGLRAIAAAGTVDLSRHRNFVFNAKLLSSAPDLADAPRLPAGTTVEIAFDCSSVTSSGPGGFSVDAIVAPSADWRTFTLSLTTFSQPTLQSVPIDRQACLTLVDGIIFQIQPTLSDGQATSGKLSIDNVYLQ
jgi:hypothetical protein